MTTEQPAGPDQSTIAVAPAAMSAMAEADLRRARRYLGGIYLILLFTGVYFAREVLLPVVMGVLIALTISPLIRAMGRFGLSAAVAAGIVMAVLGVVLVLAGFLLSGPVTTLIDEAPAMGEEVRWKLRGLMAQLAEMQAIGENLSSVAAGAVAGEEDVARVVVSQPGLISQTASSVASIGSSVVAAFFLALFLLASGDFFHRRLVEAVPTLTDKKRALTIVRDIERQISRYLGTVTVINAGLAVVLGLSLWGLGMPYPHLWGIAAFFLNFLPFIGAIVGIVLSAAVGIVTYDTLPQAMLPPLAYLALTSIEGQIVTPMFVGRQLEMNIVAVFLTVILWVWLWGVPGAVLAVPFLVAVKVIADNVEGMRSFGLFLGTGAAE